MNHQKVQQILGTPLLQDIFNQQRSDYVYRYTTARGEVEQRVLSVFYDSTGQLLRWTGSGLPSSSDLITSEIQPQVLNQDVLAANKPEQVIPLPVLAPSTPIAKKMPVEDLEQPLAIEPIIKSQIKAWQRAWQAKLLPQYAALYADGYVADTGNHEFWLKQRQYIFDMSGDISVLSISDLKIIQTNNNEARATFTQQYQSAILKEVGTKHLYFQRFGDEWKIVAERFFKAK